MTPGEFQYLEPCQELYVIDHAPSNHKIKVALVETSIIYSNGDLWDADTGRFYHDCDVFDRIAQAIIQVDILNQQEI